MKSPIWFKLTYNKRGKLLAIDPLPKHLKDKSLLDKLTRINPCDKEGLRRKLNSLENGLTYHILSSIEDSVGNKRIIVQARQRYF